MEKEGRLELGSLEPGRLGRPLRILQVHNFYQQAGGEDVVFRTEGKLLRDAGQVVDAYVASNDDIGSRWQKMQAAVSITWSRKHYTALRHKIRDFRPDVVHVHNFFPLITPAVFDAAKDEGVWVVLTLHNYRLTCAGATLFRQGGICEKCIHGSPYHAVRYGCYRGSRFASLAVARMIDNHRWAGTWHTKVDRFIALTHFQRNKMIDAGLPAAKIVVKPNTMDDPLPPGASVDGPRHGALYVGRLSPEKGVELLVDAWREIDYPLTVVGGGPLETTLQAYAPAKVRFLGQQPPEQVSKLMLAAKFLIMPSIWYEGFPMTLLEALACGLPVVVSDVGSLGELAAAGAFGWTFKSGDRNDFIVTVHRALASPTSSAAERALRQHFLDHYSPGNALELLLACYFPHATCMGLPQ